jgi:hypothetical protein
VCPAASALPYARAQATGERYLALGHELAARYRDIRRADDLGDTLALTPDYRLKIKEARDRYQRLLNEYREMRVAFYDQLGAEMRHASCKTPLVAAPPLDILAEPAPPPEPPARRPSVAGAGSTVAAAALDEAGSASPAIWIDIDNSLCAQPTRVSIDGQPLGAVGARQRTSLRTRAGPRAICALPASDLRACGDAGTVRKAYLHEGWTLAVHCER